MTDDGLPLTRRRVLAGIAGAGTLGSGAGAFTAATLGDRELLPIGMTAGSAGIAVDCEAADCVVDDGVLQFAFDVAPDGKKRSRSFALTVDDNPVRVWARTDCPPESDDHDHHDPPKKWPWNGRDGDGSGGKSPEDGPPEQLPERPPDPSPNGSASTSRSPEVGTQTFGGDWFGASLEEVLELRVSIADPCGLDGTQLYPDGGDDWGTLQGFQTAFADGRRLDVGDPCFEAGDDVCLELEYHLPWWYAFLGHDDEADLELELYAEQCRHVSGSAVQNPFEPADCGSEPDPDPEPCRDCTELGKLEVEGDRLETGETYALDELEAPFDDDHEYEIEVIDVENKDGGAETICVEFALRRDGEESLRMCKVKLKGATERWTEELDPPDTRTAGTLCTGETEAGNSGNTHQPAISHLTVYVCDDGKDHHDDKEDDEHDYGGKHRDEEDPDGRSRTDRGGEDE